MELPVAPGKFIEGRSRNGRTISEGARGSGASLTQMGCQQSWREAHNCAYTHKTTSIIQKDTGCFTPFAEGAAADELRARRLILILDFDFGRLWRSCPVLSAKSHNIPKWRKNRIVQISIRLP